jgi:hypothetical protein
VQRYIARDLDYALVARGAELESAHLQVPIC